MFQYPPPRHRHPFQSVGFWVLVVAGFGCLAIWKSGWLHVSTPVAFTPVTEETMPDPPPGAESLDAELNLLTDDFEPAPFQSQEDPDEGASSPFVIQTQELVQTAELPAWASEPPPVQSVPDQKLPPPPEQREPEFEPAPEPVPVDPFSTFSTESRSRPSEGALTQSVARTNPPAARASSIIQTSATDFSPNSTATPSDHGVQDAFSARQASAPADPDQLDFAAIEQLLVSGDEVGAHRQLSTWYWLHPKHRRHIQDRLSGLAKRIYFQPRPHFMAPHTVRFGDRLETIAKQYAVSWEYLARLNQIEDQKIQAGQQLKVIQGPFSVVIDLSEYEMIVHAHGYYVTRFQVGNGRDDTTPIGTFQVTDKVFDPTYYGPDGVIEHDDPANPLGERWIAINDEQGSLDGYGIHGTIDPSSIGRSQSRGCIRLRDSEIVSLYDLLTIGSEVIIRR